MRKVIDTTTNEHGEETHPAFGMIGASRVTSSPPGAVLFDSEIRHQHSVIIRIGTAVRQRRLSRDWLRRKQEFVEVELSEAQWASFVSSMNVGDGVPCTIRRREDKWDVPGIPFAPRMEESLNEVRGAADRVMATIREKFAAYAEKKTAANLRSLQAAIDNAPSNMTFAASSLSEHAENVVQKARADIEAMVVSKAEQLGLSEAEAKELMPGDTKEES